jgi:hypothetical protein
VSKPASRNILATAVASRDGLGSCRHVPILLIVVGVANLRGGAV